MSQTNDFNALQAEKIWGLKIKISVSKVLWITVNLVWSHFLIALKAKVVWDTHYSRKKNGEVQINK